MASTAPFTTAARPVPPLLENTTDAAMAREQGTYDAFWDLAWAAKSDNAEAFAVLAPALVGSLGRVASLHAAGERQEKAAHAAWRAFLEEYDMYSGLGLLPGREQVMRYTRGALAGAVDRIRGIKQEQAYVVTLVEAVSTIQPAAMSPSLVGEDLTAVSTGLRVHRPLTKDDLLNGLHEAYERRSADALLPARQALRDPESWRSNTDVGGGMHWALLVVVEATGDAFRREYAPERLAATMAKATQRSAPRCTPQLSKPVGRDRAAEAARAVQRRGAAR